MKRRTFIKNIAIGSGLLLSYPTLAGNFYEQNDELLEKDQLDFPLLDLHVHTTSEFTIDMILNIGNEKKVNFGIVEHPAQWALKDDNDLKKYIENLKKYPVYIGLQPTYLGWSKNYSQELISQLDYVLMDAQMVPKGNGETWRIWEFDTYIENTEDFMKRYMDYAIEILCNEPINVFAWPLFLPVCISRDYYKLWTDNRMEQILKYSKKRNIAIEINDLSHTPHQEFILEAKKQGLKFTFGSDSRNMNVGKLCYCKQVAQKCGLTKEDFYTPQQKKV